MIKMLEHDKEFLLKNIDNAEELIAGNGVDGINAIIDAIDDWIFYHGFDSEDEPNDRGREAQRVLDSIYQNVE